MTSAIEFDERRRVAGACHAEQGLEQAAVLVLAREHAQELLPLGDGEFVAGHGRQELEDVSVRLVLRVGDASRVLGQNKTRHSCGRACGGCVSCVSSLRTAALPGRCLPEENRACRDLVENRRVLLSVWKTSRWTSGRVSPSSSRMMISSKASITIYVNERQAEHRNR